MPTAQGLPICPPLLLLTHAPYNKPVTWSWGGWAVVSRNRYYICAVPTFRRRLFLTGVYVGAAHVTLRSHASHSPEHLCQVSYRPLLPSIAAFVSSFCLQFPSFLSPRGNRNGDAGPQPHRAEWAVDTRPVVGSQSLLAGAAHRPHSPRGPRMACSAPTFSLGRMPAASPRHAGSVCACLAEHGQQVQKKISQWVHYSSRALFSILEVSFVRFL